MTIDDIFKGKTNKTFLQLIRYTFVGGFAFLVDFSLLYLLTDMARLNYLVSASIGFVAGLLVNYIISVCWVFTNSITSNKLLEFLIFALIGVVGLLFTDLLMWIFTSLIGIYYLLSKIITTILVYLWNFFARKYIIYNKKQEDE